MKNDLTELVFIIDRSGSMEGLEKDTIGGYNGFIKRQKAEKGDAILTTVLFDDKYELLHNRIDIREIISLTDTDYYVGGSTALLDAIGRTIESIERKHYRTPITERPVRVMFVIITDGMENSSTNYDIKEIRKMIECQKDECGWEFLFLAANIDAIETAQSYGIPKNRSLNFRRDSAGISNIFGELDETASYYRNTDEINENWKDNLEADYDNRKNK